MVMRMVAAALILATIIAGQDDMFDSDEAANFQTARRNKAWTIVADARNDAIWKAPGNEKTDDWMALHGTTKKVNDEIKSLVKRCKILMFEKEGYKVTRQAIAQMDEFLYGVLPTMEQAEACVELHSPRHKRKLYNFKSVPARKWPMPIKFKFDGHHTPDARKMIIAAIKHWEKETCLTFQLLAANASCTEQHLLFTTQTGCFSYVGRVSKEEHFPQQININSQGCSHWLGLTVHEIGHAIGFWHEHVRTDRNSFVEVDKQKVYPWYYTNYEIVASNESNTMHVPYDHGSVLHYCSTELSVGHQRSITSKNKLYQQTMGQRVGLSFFDSKLANLAYCPHKCDNVKPVLKCKRGGYRDPKDCSKCKCPEGYGGDNCLAPAKVSGGCRPNSSGIIKVTSTENKCLESRNFRQAGGEGRYENGDKCNWLLKAPKGKRIEVWFAGGRFSTYCYDNGPTCFQWVEIKYKKNQNVRGPRFCCNDGIPKFNGKQKLRSMYHRMMVIFNAEYPLFTNSYSKEIPAHYKKGFKLCYRLAA